MRLDLLDVTAGHAGVVVDGVSLTVASGEVVAVVGPNGAGKTSLLDVVAGLLTPLAGRVVVDGRDVAGTSTAWRARQGIAYVPARRHLFPGMTVADNLLLGAYPRRPTAAALAAVHDLFPVLADRSRQAAGTLSGGEQQMLAVARALVGRPRLLVLDEPSTGLAPAIVASAFAALARLRATGMSILLAEQQAAHALALADHGHVLDRGRVVASGSAAELAADPSVRAAYLGVGP